MAVTVGYKMLCEEVDVRYQYVHQQDNVSEAEVYLSSEKIRVLFRQDSKVALLGFGLWMDLGRL